MITEPSVSHLAKCEMEKVELKLQLTGILPHENETRALVFCFNYLLIVHLNFTRDISCARNFSMDNLKYLGFYHRKMACEKFVYAYFEVSGSCCEA